MKISAKAFTIAAILLFCVAQVCLASAESMPVQMSSFSTFVAEHDGGIAGIGRKIGKVGKFAKKVAKGFKHSSKSSPKHNEPKEETQGEEEAPKTKPAHSHKDHSHKPHGKSRISEKAKAIIADIKKRAGQ